MTVAKPRMSQSENLERTFDTALAVTAVVLTAVCLRPAIVSIGPLLPRIIDEFKLSHSTASLLTSLPAFLMGLLALPTPWLAGRYGRDRILIVSLSVLFFSTLGRSLSSNACQLLFFTTGVGGGIAVAGALVAGFIKARFPCQTALMMGVYAGALSLGTTISAAVSGLIAESNGNSWRLASGGWALLAMLAMIAWAIASRRQQFSLQTYAPDPWRFPIRKPKAWLIALFFSCINLIFYAILSWSVPMYMEAGFSMATVGYILATFTAVFTCSGPIFGLLSRSKDRRFWLAACAGLVVAGLATTALYPSQYPLLSMATCAAGLGGAFSLGMMLPLDNSRNGAETNVWNAVVFSIGYRAAASGPFLVGLARDLTGDFSLAFCLLGAVALTMIGLAPFLQPMERRSCWLIASRAYDRPQ